MLEITEDEIIRDPEWLREIATQVRLYNAAISIDDFGSAYASLSRLKDLPFSELKLDRSFVTGCAADPLKRGLCQTVVDLGHRFGATVCAEGVEQEGDLRSLISQSFDTAQGYFFARPMPASELMAFLTKDTHWQIGLADARPAAAPARGASPSNSRAVIARESGQSSNHERSRGTSTLPVDPLRRAGSPAFACDDGSAFGCAMTTVVRWWMNRVLPD